MNLGSFNACDKADRFLSWAVPNHRLLLDFTKELLG
jgi:hypothetical protein